MSGRIKLYSKNINNREEQANSTHADEYYFIWRNCNGDDDNTKDYVNDNDYEIFFNTK